MSTGIQPEGARTVTSGSLIATSWPVAATTWRAGFALVALFPLAGYAALRRVA